MRNKKFDSVYEEWKLFPQPSLYFSAIKSEDAKDKEEYFKK
jgi:hypothetical protein